MQIYKHLLKYNFLLHTIKFNVDEEKAIKIALARVVNKLFLFRDMHTVQFGFTNC